MKIFSKIFSLLLFLSPLAWAFDLEGKVKIDPPYPEPRLLSVSEKHRADCGIHKISSTLKVSPDGEIANAVVKLEGAFPEKGLSREGSFVLDQIHCEFTPHVLLLPQGATLSILNSDGFLHNVRAFDEKTEMLFNDAMPRKGQVLKKRFDRAGRFVVRCGIHPWMYGVAVVQEHPFYAVTDESGHFKMEGIPDGTYKISVWHEELGELRSEASPTKNALTLAYPAFKGDQASNP